MIIEIAFGFVLGVIILTLLPATLVLIFGIPYMILTKTYQLIEYIIDKLDELWILLNKDIKFYINKKE